MTILGARDIGISFGGIKAIDGVNFSVSPGQILSIIGPNGEVDAVNGLDATE